MKTNPSEFKFPSQSNERKVKAKPDSSTFGIKLQLKNVVSMGPRIILKMLIVMNHGQPIKSVASYTHEPM